MDHERRGHAGTGGGSVAGRDEGEECVECSFADLTMPGRVKSKAKGHKKEPAQTFSLVSDKTALNPALAALFTSSAGPVKAPSKRIVVEQSSDDSEVDSDSVPTHEALNGANLETEGTDEEDDDEELSEASEEFSDPSDEDEESDAPVEEAKPSIPEKRKRKRNEDEDDLEAAYFEKLAREEAKEQKVSKKQKKETAKPRQLAGDDEAEQEQDNSDAAASSDDLLDDEDAIAVPVHETLAAPETDIELDKASRTVFLANVSTTAITSKSDKKTLLNHLASFFPHLATDSPKGSKASSAAVHKVESLRFRSTAFSSSVPKKAAFAKREIMDETSKSTNAYAVYSTKLAAREAAARLNGTVILGRHLRVDSVAHPAPTDHRRCVFVGNLGFIDDETNMRAVQRAQGDNAVRKPQNGDVEEGLWVQFSKAGKVESVRVVRDPKTRVGKGIAYVQFADQNGVEAALLFNEKKYPPLLPRKLRVSRAKKNTGPKPEGKVAGSKGPLKNGVRTSQKGGKLDPEQQSLKGRAAKLFGRAGAASVKSSATQSNATPLGNKGSFKSPESFVFEGHRASSSQGNKGLKLGKGSGKKKDGRPRSRSAKRGAEWKKKGGK
ncbi:hypothetical protein FH972_024184 [Carpinus fangiana]|uniref:RRM domain-containing protein n=1 Tax=Carpinus fangiana TaxID=176857 RepID=A0A5N6KY48_9ROSI|nr:hypothetical protein FH972_024184 [Carpinus fangiana]